MKIVIAGGSGFIGRDLIDKLLGSGHKIVVLTRNKRLVNLSSIKNLIFVYWDASTLTTWAKHIDGASTVINLAGEPLAEKRWTGGQKRIILSSRVESTKVIVRAIKEANHRPVTFISLSAVGYYGNVPEGEVDEDHPPGDSFLADVCVKWEYEALKAERLGVRTAIIRGGLVLERDGGVLGKMLSTFRLHAGGIPGSGQQWVPWIHRDDMIAIIEFVLESEGITGPVNAMAPKPVKMKEFVETLVKVIKKPIRATVPDIIVRTALGEMADMILTGQKAIPRRLLDQGFKFKYIDLQKALEAIFN